MRLNTEAGVARSAISTAVAPMARAKVCALPRPYAKASFAAEKSTSFSVAPATSDEPRLLLYSSRSTGMPQAPGHVASRHAAPARARAGGGLAGAQDGALLRAP